MLTSGGLLKFQYIFNFDKMAIGKFCMVTQFGIKTIDLGLVSTLQAENPHTHRMASDKIHLALHNSKMK